MRSSLWRRGAFFPVEAGLGVLMRRQEVFAVEAGCFPFCRGGDGGRASSFAAESGRWSTASRFMISKRKAFPPPPPANKNVTSFNPQHPFNPASPLFHARACVREDWAHVDV